MNVMIGRCRIRRNFPYYIYGQGKRAYHLRCQFNPEFLSGCKVLVPHSDKRDYSHQTCRLYSRTLHGLDLQQIPGLRSWSRQNITDFPIYGFTPQGVYVLSFPTSQNATRLMSTGPDASSKVEETVRRLKEKHEEKLKDIHKIKDIDLRVKSVIELDQETDRAVKIAVQKMKEDSNEVGKVNNKNQ